MGKCNCIPLVLEDGRNVVHKINCAAMTDVSTAASSDDKPIDAVPERLQDLKILANEFQTTITNARKIQTLLNSALIKELEDRAAQITYAYESGGRFTRLIVQDLEERISQLKKMDKGVADVTDLLTEDRAGSTDVTDAP